MISLQQAALNFVETLQYYNSKQRQVTDLRITEIEKALAALKEVREVTAPVVAPASDVLYDPDRCGVNIPYIHFGNDILSKPEWNRMSLSKDSEKRRLLAELFTITKEEGFSTVRFWLFPSFWHGVDYTSPLVKEEVRDSIQILCDAAYEADVTLIPTLLSFNNWDHDKVQWGAQDPADIPYTFYRVVLEQLGSYGDVINYVDLINEPEWVMSDIPNADPHSPTAPFNRGTFQQLMSTLEHMCDEEGLEYGYGLASRKWHDAGILKEGDVRDYHNYMWSQKWFPAEEAKGTGLYMGETDVPYSEWEKFFKGDKYAMVMGWFEPKEYRTGDVWRTTLKQFKQR